MNRFDRLLNRLNLQQAQPNVYLGGAGQGGVGGEARLFGGLVAAQATMAAQMTETNFPIHSLHAYFLRPGQPEHDIQYHVSHDKQGRNFAVRTVKAWQNNNLIFQLQASLQRPEPGVEHQQSMPQAPQPHNLPNRDQLRGRSYWQDMPIDVRMASEITGTQTLQAEQQVWLKANGELPNNPALHVALVVYASDRSLLDTAWRPHAHRGQQSGASLDHAMWFHHTPKFDDWLLFDMLSPAASGGRGFSNRWDVQP